MYLIKILLVDDHEIVRVGLRKLLAEVKDFEVVAEASSGEQALELVVAHPINVVLMDIKMPGIGGLESTRRLLQTNPKLKIIVLSACTQAPYPYHLILAGAKGYLTKDCRMDEVVEAIYKVNSGKTYFESKIVEQLALKTIDDQSGKSFFSALSSREMQVVLMLVEADSVAKIAEKLHLSSKTVSTYRYRLLQKLGVKNNVELIRLAMRHGVMDKPISLE